MQGVEADEADEESTSGSMRVHRLSDPAAAEARTLSGRESTSSSVELGGGKRLEREPLLEAEKGMTPKQLDAHFRGLGKHGCRHYFRRCKLVVPCCPGKVFWCRHCHNEACNSPLADPASWHELDRKTVELVECALCETQQPVSGACTACGVSFGRYHCLICRFFDDDTSKGQFHCDKCDICRVGGRDNFFHCDRCGCCYSVSIKDGHKCVERSMHSNCPVCFEFLFDSVRAISVMRCGHTIHEHCFQQLFEHQQYACPMCCQSMCDMTQAWRIRDHEVENTPMPEEYRDRMETILCNDCGQWSETPYHGLKCRHCNSYNTRK